MTHQSQWVTLHMMMLDVNEPYLTLLARSMVLLVGLGLVPRLPIWSIYALSEFFRGCRTITQKALTVV
jgi:hypothetical protein